MKSRLIDVAALSAAMIGLYGTLFDARMIPVSYALLWLTLRLPHHDERRAGWRALSTWHA